MSNDIHMTLGEFLLARIAEEESVLPTWTFARLKKSNRFRRWSLRQQKKAALDPRTLYSLQSVAQHHGNHPDFNEAWRPNLGSCPKCTRQIESISKINDDLWGLDSCGHVFDTFRLQPSLADGVLL